MSEQVTKITALQVENFKRVKAVELTPKANGLTIIGGDNRQGKTSVLEAISSSLGGQRLDPTSAVHEGAKKGRAVVTLSNGITVEKSFTDKNSYLKVTAENGMKGGQQLLDSFISEFALDIGTFIRSKPKAQANILIQSIGVDLSPFDMKLKEIEAERLLIGQQKTSAEGHEREIIYDEEAGLELKSPAAMMGELEEVVNHNAKLRDAANKVTEIEREIGRCETSCASIDREVVRLEQLVVEAKQKATSERAKLDQNRTLLKQAKAAAAFGVPKDDTEIRKRMADVEAFNGRVRMNLEKKSAAAKVASLVEQYKAVNQKVEEIRADRMALLEKAGLPLIELSVENEVLLYKGKEFDCMSGAEQMIVATAICRKIKPQMGFVLVDKLESMDLKSLTQFGDWAMREGLQVIGTRVSQGDECSIIIEDGMVAGEGVEQPTASSAKTVEPKAETEEPANVRKRTFNFGA